ncbi:hypothetical protein ACLQ2R_04680 [Streptosporangium sp. DT93]|uniref:hypothetical protein n=1 Tax=Streptosporangium sp. DT93 TaxID=3393428 RepID=UPI003CF24637
MRPSTRTFLGLTAATAVLALGVPALASPALAAPAAAPRTAAVVASGDYDEYWGYHYSKYDDDSRAKAKGHVWTDDDDRVHLQGRLYDPHSPNRLCGYAQFKFETHDGDEKNYWARKCGSSGYAPFHFTQHEIDNLQVRVCYWDRHEGRKTLCGKWRYIYEADADNGEE